MAVFFAGQRMTAAELNLAVQSTLPNGRGRRTTASTAASALQGVERLDDLAAKASRLHYICCPIVHANSTVTTDQITISIHYTTDGSTPTTASAIIPGGQMVITAGDESALGCYYVPSADETLSLLVSTFRFSGTGNVSVFADGTRLFEILVFDLGPDAGDTGTDI